MSTHKLFLLLSLSTPLLAGCAAELGADELGDLGADEADGADEATEADDADGLGEVMIGTATQSIDSGWAVGPFWNDTANSSVALRPVSTHHCVLSRVGGYFAGGGEEVRVEPVNGTWYLTIRTQQPGTGQHGEAFCFAKNAFYAHGDARWSSGLAFVSNGGGSGCTAGAIDLWWGDAASMLQGITGNFRGGGEWATVGQSPYPFTGSTLNAHSCSGMVGAYGGSFFAGTPSSGVPAKFWGGEYEVTTDGLITPTYHREVELAPTNEAMCYLTRVAGRFDGGGEYVAVYPKRSADGIERWHLITRAGAKTWSNQIKEIWGSARCFRRDQR